MQQTIFVLVIEYYKIIQPKFTNFTNAELVFDRCSVEAEISQNKILERLKNVFKEVVYEYDQKMDHIYTCELTLKFEKLEELNLNETIDFLFEELSTEELLELISWITDDVKVRLEVKNAEN